MRARTACLLGAVALAGCGDIIGLGGYTDGDGSVDSSGIEAGGGDAQSDAKADVAADGGGDGVAPEASCNTATSVCVPVLPSGWSWAVYAPDSRGACATGYTTPTDVEEGIDAGAATCGCGCTTNNPSCATGTITITAGTNNTCDNITSQADPADAGCNATTQFSTSNAGISVTGPAPSGGSCTPNPSQTLPPVGYLHQGRTCGYAPAPSDGGDGCGDAGVCLPLPAPFAMCISQAGANACPTDFPTQHLVGTAISDTRGCTTCDCTFTAGTCTGTATLYTNTGCTTNAQTVTADGNCHNVFGNRTWRGYTYSPTSNASCTGTAVSADGGVVFSDLTTICCR